MFSALIVSDRYQTDFFQPMFSDVHFALSINEARTFLETQPVDLFFIDVEVLNKSAEQVIRELREAYPKMELILLTEKTGFARTLFLMKSGALKYLLIPVMEDELSILLYQIECEQTEKEELLFLRSKTFTDTVVPISKSETIKDLDKAISAVAKASSTVLITGETGTGKTLLAKQIHLQGRGAKAPFINVHCGAIPENLLESELFGHEKGAFTGAYRQKLGKFEIANGGTLFLDEIGTISSSLQVKLLKVLQEKSFSRVGGEEDVHSNCRVIAATNDDLKSLCEEGLFRWDLYYRLNVFPINVPPLRERKEDILNLTSLFIEKFNQYNLKEIKGVTKETLHLLELYDWPGNIRELENIIERSHILEESEYINVQSLPMELLSGTKQRKTSHYSLSEYRQYEVDKAELRYLRNVLTETKGRINKAAMLSGVTTRYLNVLMKKHELNKNDFK